VRTRRPLGSEHFVVVLRYDVARPKIEHQALSFVRRSERLVSQVANTPGRGRSK
jgi:hypothetical protein